jgi:protocatechuate 3,4-dioxygenase alpha subunit
VIPATASQTIGPYWHLIRHPEWADLTRLGAEGPRIEILGRITDGDAKPVTDACVELWQASPAQDATFPGWGRAATDADGMFRFVTLKPGPVAGRGNAMQAPHCALTILARGIMTSLRTRLYFADEALNETDPVLALIEDPVRRATLVAQPAGPAAWRLDISLQGGNETVFFGI